MSRPHSTKTKKSPYFVFLAALLFITTGWVGIGGIREYSDHLVASQGQVATATITKKVMHRAGQEGYTKTSYEEDFAFSATDGERIEGKTDVTPDYWDRNRLGDTFKVTYAASQPGTYRIGTNTSTTVSDCIFLAIVVMWLVVMRLTIRALHSRPTPRTISAAAPDTAANPLRPVAAKASFNGPVLVGAGLSSIGLLFLLIGVANLVGERSFRTLGKAATAIVLTKSSVHGKNGDSYPLGVRFTTDEGRSIETSMGVDRPTMSSLREHLPIKIIYLPKHPEQIRLASDDRFSAYVFLWFVSALGVILAIGGAIIISFSLLDAKRQRRLHGEG